MRSGGHRFLTKGFVVTVGAALTVALPGLAPARAGSVLDRSGVAGVLGVTASVPATPIKHVVVIFQENVSFDHYFGTYPVAANTSGQPFRGDHPSSPVNGLWGLARIRRSFDATAGTLTALFDFRHGNQNPTLYLDPATGQLVNRHS
jgi:hypothetical protein